MSKFLLITKINILQTFNLSRKNSGLGNNNKKSSLKVIGILAVVGYLMWYIYMLTKSLMPAFVAIGKPLYMIAFLFVMCTFYLLFANVFRIKSILFDFKDYDLLMSLPIRRSSILSSKIVSLYIIDLIYTLIIMLPGYVSYVTTLDMPHDAMFFLLLLTIPIIPILVSIILGTIITWITSLFRNKNIGSYVVNLSIIFIALFISFTSMGLSDEVVVSQSINMVDSLSKYYPFTTLFVSLLENINIINLLIYFLIPILLMGIFMIFVNKGYVSLRSKLLRQKVRNNYKVNEYKNNSPLIRLYKKELKKYFSNSMYVINTAFGCVIMIIIVLAMLFNNDLISQLGNLEILKSNIFLVLSLFCSLSSTTNASISLEGKSLWIMKSIPVKPSIIFLSKIMVNLTILVPTVILAATFFGIYLNLPFMSRILLYIVPLTYSIFISIMGLILNLIFPKFDFANEMNVIKQSLPVFLTTLIGMIMVIAVFTLLNKNNLLVAITMIVIDIVLVIILKSYGERKFKTL